MTIPEILTKELPGEKNTSSMTKKNLIGLAVKKRVEEAVR